MVCRGASLLGCGASPIFSTARDCGRGVHGRQADRKHSFIIRGGGLIATRFSKESRSTDALSIMGVGDVGDWKAVQPGPKTLGVVSHFACSVQRWWKEGGEPALGNNIGVYGGGPGETNLMSLRCGVGECDSIS